LFNHNACLDWCRQPDVRRTITLHRSGTAFTLLYDESGHILRIRNCMKTGTIKALLRVTKRQDIEVQRALQG
jgi:hypothetical protein